MATVMSQPDALPATRPAQGDLKVYPHSPLLYWWPVWAVGLIAALWTAIDSYHMVLVPPGTAVAAGAVVLPSDAAAFAPFVHVARSPVPGALFVTTLLAVVLFGNMYLRGIWALFAAACLIALALLLSWMEWWHELFDWLRAIRVYMNLGTYLAISVPVLIAWALAVFIFDRRTYLVFSTGQVRYHDELGGEEQAFDTGAVAFEKRPFDWFRWLIGRGAGDLIVRIGGPQPQTVELPNVTHAGRWLDALEERLRTRDVV